LLWPDPQEKLDTRIRDIFFAEANNRLAAPLYCLAFALIAFAAVTHGRGGRGVYALRLTGACILTATLRIVGYGAQGVAARNPALCIILYLIPLLGAAIGLVDILGLWPVSLFARRHGALQGAPA